MVRYSSFMAGVIVGACIIGLIAGNIGIVPEWHEAKEQCEQQLSRDKECVMTFVEE